MTKSNKKVALKAATFAALFGVMSFFMDMMEENEEQITYSVTLQDLALGNGETNGENGGTVGSGGADGESGGGTTPTSSIRGYSKVTISEVTQMEIRDIDQCTEETRTREATITECEGRGTLRCTPFVVPTTRWSAWSLRTKDEDGCQ